MTDVNAVLAAHDGAVLDLVSAAERSAATWTTPPAPGKWSPSQVVEHVLRGLDEAANALSGAPSSIPMPPAIASRCPAQPKGCQARRHEAGGTGLTLQPA